MILRITSIIFIIGIATNSYAGNSTQIGSTVQRPKPGVWSKIQHWRSNNRQLSFANAQGDLYSRPQRMRNAHEVYNDPKATKGQKRKALRVLRATYASVLGWSHYHNKGTVRRAGMPSKSESGVHQALADIGFNIKPDSWLKQHQGNMIKDKGLPERIGVPLELLTTQQPLDNWRNAVAPLGNLGRVQSKLKALDSLITEATNKLQPVK